MLDLLLKLSLALGAGGVALKLASERVVSDVAGLNCKVVVPRQDLMDWITGSSGIWNTQDREYVALYLGMNEKVIQFARDHHLTRIKIYPPLTNIAGQVRVPTKIRDGELNVFIYSTPKQSREILLPSLSDLEPFRALSPTSEGARTNIFGHPLVQFEHDINSVYFLGLIWKHVSWSTFDQLLQVFQSEIDEPDNDFLSLENILPEDLYCASSMWTQELVNCITSEAKKNRDVDRVELQDNLKFSVFTSMIVYNRRKIGEFKIDYDLNPGGYSVTWHNLTYPPGTITELGRVVGNAPLVDATGQSTLYLALVDIPAALASYRIEEAVRLSIRVLKSPKETKAFNAALECYPLVS